MGKPRKNKKLRLITKLEDKLEYWKNPPLSRDYDKIRELRDMCPNCSDKKTKKRVYRYWVLRDRGPKYKPRWEKVNKKCPVCNRIFSLKNREVETF